MPRNVRNFWVTAHIDGRRTDLEGGPSSRDGGIRLTIKQRDRGGIVTAAHIDGRADADGRLVLALEPGTGVTARIDGDRIVIETAR